MKKGALSSVLKFDPFRIVLKKKLVNLVVRFIIQSTSSA